MRLIGQPEDWIATVSLNPSLDRTLSIQEFHPKTLHLAGLMWAVACGTAAAI
jgi:fructose-1-phosphate kinase PfkB-like protein